MPIKIPDHLPARAALEAEGVMVMRETDAVRQDIRPLRIALLNLMPDKPRTETQFARLLAASPLQIELSLVQMTGRATRHTPAEHMSAFYRTWAEVCVETFDGLIVTGAPVETLDFDQVTYWDELRRVFDWTQTHVHACLNICWSAQASLRHFHGVPKHALPEKRFGVFRHRNLAPASPFLRGFSDDFCIPVSRWAETRREDLPRDNGLSVLMESDEAGLCLLEDPTRRALHMFNHVEYDSTTLAEEYFRDLATDPRTALPRNYFPKDDPARTPENSWRSHAHLLFGNWINQIYQTTPFDIRDIGK